MSTSDWITIVGIVVGIIGILGIGGRVVYRLVEKNKNKKIIISKNTNSGNGSQYNSGGSINITSKDDSQ